MNNLQLGQSSNKSNVSYFFADHHCLLLLINFAIVASFCVFSLLSPSILHFLMQITLLLAIVPINKLQEPSITSSRMLIRLFDWDEGYPLKQFPNGVEVDFNSLRPSAWDVVCKVSEKLGVKVAMNTFVVPRDASNTTVSALLLLTETNSGSLDTNHRNVASMKARAVKLVKHWSA